MTDQPPPSELDALPSVGINVGLSQIDGLKKRAKQWESAAFAAITREAELRRRLLAVAEDMPLEYGDRIREALDEPPVT